MTVIQFTPIEKSVLGLISPPISANKLLPEWYRHQEAIINNEELEINDNGVLNTTIKKCMPVLDDMSAGYYITLPSDIIVSYEEESQKTNVGWTLDLKGYKSEQPSNLPPIVSSHSLNQISSLEMPYWLSSAPFKWNNYWRITTPAGYSCLFRQPSWRFDLPFYTASGIVDTDRHPVAVNFPFFFLNGWHGIIEAGTPIVQVIPFKRDDWESEVVGEDNYEGQKEFRRTTNKLMHRYKDNWRSIKSWK